MERFPKHEKREGDPSGCSMCDFRNHVPDNHVVIFRVMMVVSAETVIGTATDRNKKDSAIPAAV